jgi:hypothetical protein
MVGEARHKLPNDPGGLLNLLEQDEDRRPRWVWSFAPQRLDGGGKHGVRRYAVILMSAVKKHFRFFCLPSRWATGIIPSFTICG